MAFERARARRVPSLQELTDPILPRVTDANCTASVTLNAWSRRPTVGIAFVRPTLSTP